MTDDASDDDFAVGYKKPPRHSRFQPGKSGNPTGKEKGVRNFSTDVKRMLEVPVKLNDRGRARRVSTQEAALLRLREKALNGDPRSIMQFLELAKTFNNATAVESIGDKVVAAEDQAILDAYAEEIWSRATHVANAVKPDISEDGGEDNGKNPDG